MSKLIWVASLIAMVAVVACGDDEATEAPVENHVLTDGGGTDGNSQALADARADCDTRADCHASTHGDLRASADGRSAGP